MPSNTIIQSKTPTSSTGSSGYTPKTYSIPSAVVPKQKKKRAAPTRTPKRSRGRHASGGLVTYKDISKMK